MASAERPWGWSHGWSPFASGPAATFTLDSVVRISGTRSLKVHLAPANGSSQAPQTIVLQVPAKFAHGKHVTLRARMRSAALTGKAFATLEGWGESRVVDADTAATGPTQPPQWTTYSLGIDVPVSAHSLVITAGLEGSGTAWFDGFELTVDGARVHSFPTGVDPSPAELRFLAILATPLRTVVPAGGLVSDDSDLSRFASITAGARVVALGESTHGTREFFLVKHRILEYLVRKHDFTVFAIEANQLAVETINRYVQGGSGAADDVMRAMFRVWNTEEVRDLVEWMRQYNAAHPGRILRFVGYDMQDHRRPADSLAAFLQRWEPSLVATLEPLTRYREQRSWSTPQIADSIRARWRQAAIDLFDTVHARRAAWLNTARTRADTLQAEWGVQAANLLRQAALGNATLNV
ncbi:MAG TPA: erythromycin esterase family protein, partial [Gemmatimonadaceae bacterium]|nr:erythromycin esterase family protein [Gemmatimonadaceae bacterium]